MGLLYYAGSEMAIAFPDRVLAHVKVVTTAKLRRGESFTVSWTHPLDDTMGRSTLWMHPTIPLRFVFDEREPPELDRSWLESLSASANLAGGISIDVDDTDEPTT